MTDEEVVETLYSDRRCYLSMTFDSFAGVFKHSELHLPNSDTKSINEDDTSSLMILDCIVSYKEDYDYVNGETTILYKLSPKILSMLGTIKEYGFIKIDKHSKLTFLQKAKLAVILSHVGSGMVDFSHNGIEHTVRRRTKYDYFVEQDRLSR